MKLGRSRAGVSRADVLVTLGVIGLLLTCVVGLGLPALLKARCGAAMIRDKNQIKQIHQAMLHWAGDNNGVMPTPSLVTARKIVSEDGDELLVEDFTVNHSAPLYSMLIAMEYVPPDLVVSPRCIKEADYVRILKDYNYAAYDPARGRYWDTTFTMRIDDPTIGANGSYAHMALCGERRAERWRDTRGVGTPILGTRGTRGGADSGPEYERSPTLQIHGPRRQWVGNIVYADNHTATIDSFYPGVVSYTDDSGTPKYDNIFAAEWPHPLGNQAAPDAFLGIFIGSTENTVDDVYDPLD